MKSRRGRSVMLMIVCVAMAIRVDAVSYNPLDDFSTTNGNPNGVWSYGWMTVAFTDFACFANATLSGGVNPVWFDGAGTPGMWVNNTGASLSGVPPGNMSLHPGPGQQPCVLRWTASLSGQYAIVGQFLAGDSGGMAVGIRQNSTWLWQATDYGVFDVSRSLAAGDSIDFLVYGGYAYGNTPLDVIISSLSNTDTNLVISSLARLPVTLVSDSIGVTNVALGLPVTPHSNVVLGGPTNVTDGDYATYWFSYQGSPSHISFTLDLEQEVGIGQIRFKPNQTRTHLVETSSDGIAWTNRHSGTHDYFDSSVRTVDVHGAYSTRYIRYTGANAEEAYAGLSEIQVFGMDSSTGAASKVELHFAAASNRYYTLQRCNHLETGDWTNVLGQTDIPGSDGPIAMQDTNPSTQQFYRVTHVSGVLPGLVAYWALDRNANDRSPNANNGSANGTTPTANRFGDANRAFYFDGSGSYVGVPDSLSLDVTNMTLAFWFRMDTSAPARELVNKFGGNGNIAFGTEYLASDGKIRFRISTDGSNGTVSDCPSTTTIAMGTWYHFAGTYDGATMKTYINGILENSWAVSGRIYNSSEEVKIGRYGYYSGHVFHGAMDEVAIWNRALASNEVVKSMHPIVLR